MIAPYDTYSTAYVHTMWNLNTAKWCGNDMLILELLYALSRERLTSGRLNRGAGDGVGVLFLTARSFGGPFLLSGR